jgi:hypothetical protein
MLRAAGAFRGRRGVLAGVRGECVRRSEKTLALVAGADPHALFAASGAAAVLTLRSRSVLFAQLLASTEASRTTDVPPAVATLVVEAPSTWRTKPPARALTFGTLIARAATGWIPARH